MFMVDSSRFVVAGSGTGSHAYWRLHATAVDGGQPYCVAAELEMRATAGGATQCTGGTASADVIFNSTYDAAKAFDANAATLWVTNSAGLPHWIAYQFAAPVSVQQIALQAPDSGYGTTTEMPKDFTIDYSDNGSSWTVAQTVTNSTGWAFGEIRLFTVP